MLGVKRKTATAAAMLAGAVLVLAMWGGVPSLSGAQSAGDPRPCVATVLPDTYYQAIAEMNACTGTNVTVEIPPPDIPWGIAGELPPPGPGSRVIVDP